MSILKRIFGERKAPQPADNAPYYWGTEALNEINKLLSAQIKDTEAYLKNHPA